MRSAPRKLGWLQTCLAVLYISCVAALLSAAVLAALGAAIVFDAAHPARAVAVVAAHPLARAELSAELARAVVAQAERDLGQGHAPSADRVAADIDALMGDAHLRRTLADTPLINGEVDLSSAGGALADALETRAKQERGPDGLSDDHLLLLADALRTQPATLDVGDDPWRPARLGMFALAGVITGAAALLAVPLIVSRRRRPLLLATLAGTGAIVAWLLHPLFALPGTVGVVTGVVSSSTWMLDPIGSVIAAALFLAGSVPLAWSVARR